MAKFSRYQSIRDFQHFTSTVYSLPDDRLFSLDDLLTNMQRFTMRSLKGIRKNNKRRLKTNLMIALAWHMAIANRLHIDLEDALWHRFPMLCSYCGKKPCVCRKEKIKHRVKITRKNALRPNRMSDFQQMFNDIYPDTGRTLSDAGVHLAEETGEVSEAVHVYLGEHRLKQFEELINEMADWLSCLFGVANSANIEIAAELEKLFSDNCHICHQAPCSCSFSYVATFNS